MDQSLLKYTIRVDERAAYIRFYLWLWEADKEKITFCRLFWAYIFTAPALIVRGLYTIFVRPLIGLGKLTGKGFFWILEHLPERRSSPLSRTLERRQAEEERAKPTPEPKEKGPSTMQKTLGGIEHYGTIAAMRARPLAEGAAAAKDRLGYASKKTVHKVAATVSIPIVGRVLLGTAALASLLMVGIGVYFAAPAGISGGEAAIGATGEAAVAVVHSKFSLMAVLGTVALTVLICAIWAICMVGIPLLVMRYFLAPVGEGVAKGAVTGVETIGGGLSGFARAMKIGYYSVKTNTCPRIEVEPRPDYARTRNIERELDL